MWALSSALPCHVSTALASVPSGSWSEKSTSSSSRRRRRGRPGVPVVGGHRAAERHVHVRVAVDEARHHARAGDVDDTRAVAREVDADRLDRLAGHGDVGPERPSAVTTCRRRAPDRSSTCSFLNRRDDRLAVGLERLVLGVVHEVHGELVDAQRLAARAASSTCASTGPSTQKRSTISSGTKSVSGLPARPWWA